MEFIKYYISDDGEKYERVPKGVALLGADIPAVKTLEDVNELLADSETSNDKQKVEAYTMELEETEEYQDEENEEEEEKEEEFEGEEEEEDKETADDEQEESNPTQKGGQTLDIQDFVEEFEELSDDEQSELLSELGVESDEEYSEEYVSKLESKVESLEDRLVDQKVEAFLDEKVQEGVILDKEREDYKEIVASFDDEKFEDLDEQLGKLETLLEGRQAVDTEEYTETEESEETEDSEDTENFSDKDEDELIEEISEA